MAVTKYGSFVSASSLTAPVISPVLGSWVSPGGSPVTLKLKGADFRIRTRARRLAAPTALAARMFAAGRDLLKREADGTRFRLIGIGVSDLTGADAADPNDLDRSGARTAAAERAVDRVRNKFGRSSIVKGLVFEEKP